jgi:REP element-mobilizing transposase RayT
MPNHIHVLLRIKDDDEIVAQYKKHVSSSGPERVLNPFGGCRIEIKR